MAHVITKYCESVLKKLIFCCKVGKFNFNLKTHNNFNPIPVTSVDCFL